MCIRWSPRHERQILPLSDIFSSSACNQTELKLSLMQAVRRMLRNAQSTDITLKVIRGGFHEVMMGTERHDVTDHIIAWIDQKVEEASLAITASRRDSTESCASGSSSQPQLSMTSSMSADESSILSSGTLDEPVGEFEGKKQLLPQLRAGVGAANVGAANVAPDTTTAAPAITSLAA